MNYEYSSDEFREIRTELRERIKLMYTQNIGMLTTSLAFWAVAGTVIAMAESWNSFVCLFTLMILAMPAFIALPLSIKSGDNLTRVAQIAAYHIAFHELPSLEKEKNIICYETALFRTNHTDKNKIIFFNADYTIISCVAFLAALAYGVYTLLTLNKGTFFVIFLIAVIIILAAVLVDIVVIVLRSSVLKMFVNTKTKYINDLLVGAEKMGILDASQHETYLQYINNKVDKL